MTAPTKPRRPIITLRIDPELYAQLCDYCGRDPMTPGRNPRGVDSLNRVVSEAIREYLRTRRHPPT